ncbi:hypothetical protein [Ferruginibacter sp.]
MLAWLLDFPKRPYDDGYNYELIYPIESEKSKKDKIESDSVDTTDKEDGSNIIDTTTESLSPNQILKKNSNTIDPKRKWKIAGVIGILLAIIGGGYYSTRGSNSQQCMIWMDDHYERIACDSSVPGKLVIGVEENILNKLRRIKQRDTITEKHIGSIWYKKRSKDSIDYYTYGCPDPLNPKRDLDRLTDYMYNKYLSDNSVKYQISKTDSSVKISK